MTNSNTPIVYEILDQIDEAITKIMYYFDPIRTSADFIANKENQMRLDAICMMLIAIVKKNRVSLVFQKNPVSSFVGWVEARNPTYLLGFAALNPTYILVLYLITEKTSVNFTLTPPLTGF